MAKDSGNGNLASILRSTYSDGMFESDIGLGVFPTGFPNLDYGLGFPVDVYDKNEWKYREVHKGVLMGSYLMIVGDPATGKALPHSANIPTPTGVVKMGDLRLDDLVFARNGCPTTVVGIYEQGVQNVYRVTFSDGRTCRCTEDHLWTVRGNLNGEQKYVTLPLKDMMDDYAHVEGGKPVYQYAIPNIGIVNFDMRFTQVDSWVMGCLIGNGLWDSHELSILSASEDIPRRIAKKLYMEYKVDPNNPNRYIFLHRCDHESPVITYEYLSNQTGIYQMLKNPEIPDEYIFNDQFARLQLLRGLFEAQNCVTTPRGDKIIYRSTNKKLLEQIAYVLRSLSISCRIFHRLDNKPSELYVHIKDEVKELVFTEYGAEHLTTHLTLQEALQYQDTYITGISYDGQEKCRCIMVDDPDHLYLAEEFLPTHNTTLAEQIAANTIRPYENGLVHHLDLERAATDTRVARIAKLPRDDFDTKNPNRRYIIDQSPKSHEDIQRIVMRIYKAKMSNPEKYMIHLNQHDSDGTPITTMVPTVILCDSVPMIGLNLEMGDTKDEKKMEAALSQMDAAQSAGAFKRMMKMILGPMKAASIIFIGISHIGVKIQSNPMMHNKKDYRGMGADDIIAGGKMNQYGATNIIRTDRRGGKGYTVENGDGFNGFDSLITVVKSRTTFDAKIIPMIYDCEEGFDHIRSIIQLGIERGIITGNRASMKFTEDPECKFSYVKLYDEIQRKPEILANIKKYIIASLENDFQLDHQPESNHNIFLEY